MTGNGTRPGDREHCQPPSHKQPRDCALWGNRPCFGRGQKMTRRGNTPRVIFCMKALFRRGDGCGKLHLLIATQRRAKEQPHIGWHSKQRRHGKPHTAADAYLCDARICLGDVVNKTARYLIGTFWVFSLVVFARRQPACILLVKNPSKSARKSTLGTY